MVELDKVDSVFTEKLSDSYHPGKKKAHTSSFKTEDKEKSGFRPR